MNRGFVLREMPAETGNPTALGDERGFWSVVVPEATTNLIPNPSFETGTTGWAGIAGAETLAQDATHATHGTHALSVTPTASTTSGVAAAITLATNTNYTLACDVWGAPGVPYQLALYDVTGAVTLASVGFVGTGAWQHVVLTATNLAHTSAALRVQKAGSASTAAFYVDGAQVEQKGYATTYCDGDQEGCAWTGTPHRSLSTRNAFDRRGGRIVNWQDFKFTVTAVLGAGLTVFNAVAVPSGLTGGATFQRTIPQPRDFAVTGRFECTSLIDLHRCQQGLADALKPNNLKGPVRLIYQPTAGPAMIGHPLQIDAVYTGGLEGALSNGINESAAISFRVFLPAVLGTAMVDSGGGLAYAQSVANLNYIAQRSNGGQWAALGAGASGGGGTVSALATGADGGLYAGGLFTSMDGVANTAYIAKWISGAWQALGTGANAGVVALAIGPDGSLYAGGGFTQMDGVANTAYIAKWNGSTWTPLGTGMNAEVYALAIGPDGSLYAGGGFTSAGGVANTAHIAKWNGSAWVSLWSGINTGNVYALAVSSTGELYLGGAFTALSGTGINRIAKFYAGTLDMLGSGGANAQVNALAIVPDGTLYVGGNFTTIGGVAANYVARWNGSQWQPLGSGMGGYVLALRALPTGGVYVGGSSLSAGGYVITSTFALWTGSIWMAPDITLAGSPYIYALECATSQAGITITVGVGGVGAGAAAGITSVTNGGTVDAYPTLTLTGPMTAVELTNFTTGDALYFNLTLNAGETATLKLGPNWNFTSNWRGSLVTSVLPGSNPTTWRLAPGANSVSLFATGTTGASAASIVFRAAYDTLAGAVQ